MRTVLASLLVIAPFTALAEGETPPAPLAIELEAGKPAEITCETKAVVVAEGAPAATNGVMTLRLEFGGAEPVSQGRWTIASVDAAHKGSLAMTQRKTCEAGCPLTLAPSGEIQLWAPKPNSLDRLAEGEQLLLAVLKPPTMALRASTFRGKDIEALEEGTCRKVTP